MVSGHFEIGTQPPTGDLTYALTPRTRHYSEQRIRHWRRPRSAILSLSTHHPNERVIEDRRA